MFVSVNELVRATPFVGRLVMLLFAGVTAAIEYSSDGGVTWTYVPVSAGCNAPAGFDRCVNRIRWRLLTALSSVAPNNQGTLQFISRIR